MKAKELRSINDKELQEKIVELKKELIKINAQIATGTNPKNPKQARGIKKTIAKIKTINKERQTEKTK